METDDLVRKLKKNFKLYWSGGDPEITDCEFDELIKELKLRDPDNPLLVKLGTRISRGTEYHHTVPMLSLDKVYSYDELKRWVDKVSRSGKEEFIVQYKFDGIACKYENGHLATRGDGRTGEDISRKIHMINLVSDSTSNMLFRRKNTIIGELVYPLKKFEKNNVINGKEYKHPRNFVAGVINRKDECESGLRIDLVEYDSSPHTGFISEDLTPGLWEKIVNTSKLTKKYPTDGLVVKLKDKEYSESLGYTEHHPHGQIAYKDYEQNAGTVIRSITWQVGADRITPVAEIEPVDICGATISRVTLHNADFVRKNSIAEGDRAIIERAGMVIPHVVNIIHGGENRCVIPSACPSCGNPVRDDGVNIFCANDDCPERRITRLRNAVVALGIDYMGIELIRSLYRSVGLRYTFQMYSLKKEDIAGLEGMGEVIAEKVITQIQQTRNMDSATFLTAVGIPAIGKKICEKICEKIRVEEIISFLKGEGKLDFAGIGMISEKRSAFILDWIRLHRAEILRFYNRVNIVETESGNEKKKTVCFTGKMPEKRSYYESIAKERGLTPVDSVTAELDMLIIADSNSESTKTKKAKKLGIVIKTLESWL